MPDAESALLTNYLVVGAILFGLGVVGLLSRRNLIIMFLAVEMMLQGVSVSLVAWSRYHENLGGQMLVVFIIAVAACEAAIALALIMMLFHRKGTLDVVAWHDVRESNLPPYVDHELPEAPHDHPTDWPHLTPAGVRPEIPREQIDYRPHV